MANVEYYDHWWASAEGYDMAPGDTHHWISFPYDQGDVVDVMAHAAYELNNPFPDRELIVENVHTAVDSNDQRTIGFNVRNVGNSYIPAYRIAISVINQ